jgi:signal transduction histidine kinase
VSRPAAWSLSARLARRLAAVLAVSIVLAALAVAWRAVVAIRSLDDADLRTQAQVIAAHLHAAADGRPALDLPPAIADLFRPGRKERRLYVVVRPNGHVLLASDLAAATRLRPFIPQQDRLFRVPAVAGRRGMIAVSVPAGRWRVVVAAGHEQRDVLVDSLVGELAASGVWLLGLVGAAGIGVAVLTLRRGLAPLRRISAAAARIGPARPGLRLPEAGLPIEVLPLVGAMNQALARLEHALDAQRRFVGEAAHAMRTPLAVLMARLDALPADAETDALRADADRMARLVGQMLRMARLDGMPLDLGQALDLHAVAIEAISALAPLAIRRGVELALIETAPHGRSNGDPATVGVALTNLIENAIAHAPSGTTVEVAIDGVRRLRVLDRGPGVPEAARKLIFRRFRRGSGAAPDGAGLGLAIVAGIAATHGGSASVEPRPGGGAAFVLDLGPAPPGAERLAAGEHGAHQVFPMQHAGDHDAADMEDDQHQNQVAGEVVKVIDPGHAEPGVGGGEPAAEAGDGQQRQ